MLLFMAFLLVGCQQLEQKPVVVGDDYSYDFTEKTISVQELASRLNLQVESDSGTFIKLTNSGNSVLIFKLSNGSVYVNGREVAKVGNLINRSGLQYVDESLVSEIKPYLKAGSISPITKPAGKKASGTVVIDPGHGGKDPGATSVRKYYEKNINLIVAKKVAARLQAAGVKVIMTRSSDRFIELDDRAALANRYRADLFVSLHADAHEDKSQSGSSVYIARSASRKSNALARSINMNLQKLPMGNKGVRRANFRVLVKTKCPAVLVEMGYLTNYSDSGKLLNKGIQNNIALAIANGIINHL